MATGIIKKYDDERGYGLLFPLGEKPDAPLIFFHRTQLKHTESVPIGAEVRFTKVRSEKDGFQAADVELMELGGRRTLREARQAEIRERRNKERSQ